MRCLCDAVCGKAAGRQSNSACPKTRRTPALLQKFLEKAGAQAKANKLLSDSIFESWQATARVRGHRTDSGTVWEPGMHIRLISRPLALDVDTMLARRTLSCDRQGGTVSTLYLRPWALWLPDTAPKARRKHHKKGGDCCTCDLCAG